MAHLCVPSLVLSLSHSSLTHTHFLALSLTLTHSLTHTLQVTDQLRGWLCLAKALTASKAESVQIIDAYVQAFYLALEEEKRTNSNSSLIEIPVQAYLQVGRMIYCPRVAIVNGI